MKTALTQLIEKWEIEIGSYIPNTPIYAAFITEAKEFLEAEREQIKSAYGAGAMDASYDFDNVDSEKYYQQTYNPEQ